MEQMNDKSTVELCSKLIATTYHSYKAILGKVHDYPLSDITYLIHIYLQIGYHASDIEPWVRWAIIFSGLRYIIIYIPRTLGRPQIYCLPVM